MAVHSRAADRFGMTLVEMLLATALAGALLIVGIGWAIDGLSASQDIRDRVRWERCARALLQSMHDDWRSNAASTYRFDAMRGTIVREDRTGGPPEVVLGGVEAFRSVQIEGVHATVVQVVGPVTIERRIETRW